MPNRNLQSTPRSAHLAHMVTPSYYALLQARRAKKAHGVDLADTTAPTSQIFYWDRENSQFINPLNLQVDPNLKAASYILQANIYTFHAASSDMSNLFSDNQNNVQVSFRAIAPADGENYTWLINAGLTIAADSQLVSLAQANNQLTNFQSPADQLVVPSDANFALWVSLEAQGKESWWDKFLKAIRVISDSPMFAMVPMAKLASDAINAVDQMTQEIEQSENLATIVSGNRLDFRIQNGPSAPFVLRQGYWVVANYLQMQPYVDETNGENLRSGIELDLGSQQYIIVDRKAESNPIDVTYAVIDVELTPKGSS